MKPWVVAVIGRIGIALLRRTMRLRYRNRAVLDPFLRDTRPFLLAFWHERLLLMPYSYPKGRRITILISRHADGEYIARTMALFGHHSTRGSTTRAGSAALRALVRRMHQGYDAAFTPDGPRGPRRVAQPGVILAARLSGAPIIPVTVAASRRRLLRSWDRFVVPMPFSRGLIAYGDPIPVPRDADESTLEGARHHLEEALRALTDDADREVGAEPAPAETPA